MAELRPYNPSLRERTKQNIAGALTNLGMDNYMAQKTARGFTGSTRPDLNMAEASGVLEFTPVGLAFGLDESARGLKEARTPLDYAIEGTIGTVTLGESVAKAFPFTAQMVKFLRNLKSKNKSIAQEIVEEQAEPLIGALGNVSKTKSLQNLSPITQEIISVDTPNTVKNLFLKDTEMAKEIGGQIKNQDFRAPKFRTINNEFSDPISIDELNSTKKEIYDLTQLRYKNLPDVITVYRSGKLNKEDGVSSFSLDPNYNVELNLPWQKGRDDPLVAYKVKKSDILATPDFAEGIGKGKHLMKKK